MSNEQAVTFYTALGAKIADSELASKGGLTYIAAATASRLAGRPEVTFVDFGDKPYLECFGGALVAVDMFIPGAKLMQRTWLQVMDQDNQAMAIGSTTLNDINNARQRCLAKAIASVHGHGMSLYVGCDGDGPKAVKMLGVNPDTDLAEVKPVVAMLKENGAAYIEWGVGLSACRITDPTFYWNVVEWDGKPFREVLGGIMVDVFTTYKGKSQVLSLPIMDAAFKALPAAKVTVSDWNKTVMRALTKCIAFNSGYGLSVYADEFGVDGAAAKGKGTKGKATATKDPVEAPASAPAPAEAKAPVNEAQAPAAAPAADKAAEPAATPAAASAAPALVAEASAPAASASAVPAASAEALERFKGVMQKRRETAGTAGLISLFQALADSTKFAPEDKPGCYGALLTAVAAVVNGKDVETLLAAIKAHDAMKYLDAENKELVAARVTAEMLHYSCDLGDAELAAAPQKLIDATVAKDVDEVLNLAKAGNATSQTLDLLNAILQPADRKSVV